MIAVTTEEVEQADTAVGEARHVLREAERTYASNRTSSDAYSRHQDAIEKLDHAETRARVLREDWKEQQAVRDLRAAEGEAAAESMARDVEGLASSRTAAVRAVVEARRAMRAALESLAEHDQAVREVGKELAGRGLQCIEGERTGAALDGSVWMHGDPWPLVDGAGVLVRVLAEVVAEQDARHPVARVVLAPYGGVTAARGRDAVLEAARLEWGR